MAVMFLFVNLALFFNNYVNPVALADINWKYYIVYCCWLAVELTIVYFVSSLNQSIATNIANLLIAFCRNPLHTA